MVAVSEALMLIQGDLAFLDLTEKCYEEIGRILGKLNKPTFFVLEGSYI